jgi:hypothetical protein
LDQGRLGTAKSVEFDGGVDPLVDEVSERVVVGDLGPHGGAVFGVDVLGVAAPAAAVAELVVGAVLVGRVRFAATAGGTAHVVLVG